MRFPNFSVSLFHKSAEDLPKYSKDQFLEVAVKICPKLSKDTALLIGEETWKLQGDIRDVISIGKLVRKSDGPQEIVLIMETMSKYGMEKREERRVSNYGNSARL